MRLSCKSRSHEGALQRASVIVSEGRATVRRLIRNFDSGWR
jgi:hypothetical protein